MLTIRERAEEREYKTLSVYAAKSRESAGRVAPEEKCAVRTDFCRDRDRITHSKSFRRLMHKTQVFIRPEGDHFRTRLTHTLEVTQIARTIARALNLNEDLTEAIALGHDLGHTPFGHSGEEVLDKLAPGGFRHNEQSVRVVTVIENDGAGLNLTREVIDGIMQHRLSEKPSTLEGAVVRVSDKIAYINHDIDDAIRAGMLDPAQLPKQAVAVLGENSYSRINALVLSVINGSKGKNAVALADEEERAMFALREFMYATVYRNQLLTRERKKISFMFEMMFEYFVSHINELPANFRALAENGETHERVACDYIACMTDNYALKTFNELFVPGSGIVNFSKL